MFKMCWKHKDYPNHSEGPILRHSDLGRTQEGPLYTKQEADRICTMYNQNENKFETVENGKTVKRKLVKHWIEEVSVLTSKGKSSWQQ